MSSLTLFYPFLTLEDAKELIKNGADVNEQDDDGKTPLYYSTSFDVVKLLIDNGANVKHKSHNHRTPLFYVFDSKIAQLYIDHDADINAKDSEGFTRLHYNFLMDFTRRTVKNTGQLYKTYSQRASDIMSLLIESGAEINARTIYGATPLDFLSSEINAKKLIIYGAIAGKIDIYQKYRNLFRLDQQEAFDMYLSISRDENDFYHMCLAYQNDKKNNVKMKIKDMDIQ
jgi:hypothetical protein